MRYEITAVSDEEYAKADADLTYSPQETVIDIIECEEWDIDRRIRKRIEFGYLPKNAQYREKESLK
jgi:hypothetical protein